ncbi:MAG: DHH family phosphoesterase [Gemmatimonadota bacterium]|nr:DHH family phosphoesterase [Gemmatimonadota bacterium]
MSPGADRRATPAEANSEAQRNLGRLLDAVDPDRPIAIYTHDHPDPDSIAAAYALEHLLSRKLDADPVLAYGGTIGRATNRAMIELLSIPMQPLRAIDYEAFGTHCLIDTQPKTGNHSLPPDLPIAIAIDHHPRGDFGAPDEATFADVRTEYGATSTMMYYYLKAAGIDLPTKLATALLFGIKSDTRELEREASEADLHAYLEIFPRADLTLLARIESPRIPRPYFEAYHKALEEGVIHDGALVSDLGEVENPDLVAELADFFIPLDRIHHSLVIGRHEGRVYLSLRTREEEHDAGITIQRIVRELGTAGGHGRMAGGQIELGGGEDGEAAVRRVRRRFLEEMGLDPDAEGEPLVREQEESRGALP